MSAEPWRRSGAPVAPRLFAWQAWYFGDLRLDLRGRCGTLETFVDVRRSGTPVAPRLFAWQAWYFGDLRLDLRGRCGAFEAFVDVRGTLATKRDPWCRGFSGWICVAGVVLWRPL